MLESCALFLNPRTVLESCVLFPNLELCSLCQSRLDCEKINNICSKEYTGHLCIDSQSKRPSFFENFKICCSRNGTVSVMVLHDPQNEASDLALESADRQDSGECSYAHLTVTIVSSRHRALLHNHWQKNKDRVIVISVWLWLREIPVKCPKGFFPRTPGYT